MAIASCLVDTNILLRITRRSDPYHAVVESGPAGEILFFPRITGLPRASAKGHASPVTRICYSLGVPL